jgi:hypothetical protein
MSLQPDSARKSKVSRMAVIIGALALFATSCSSSDSKRVLNAALGATVSQTFETGDYRNFVVPVGVTSIDVSLSGAQGGARSPDEAVGPGIGGKGGVVAGQITVTPGETLTVQVGEKGADQGWVGAYPDGGVGGYAGHVIDPADGTTVLQIWRIYGAGGGGSSRIWRGTYPFSEVATLLAIAGGGGGAGEQSNGGDGGVTGGNGGEDSSFGAGGGATQDAGGYAGCTTVGSDGEKVCASPGSELRGGDADVAGSGGGGGYFGGGAGSAVNYARSGGGGSSWAKTEAFTGEATFTSGVRSGDGVVTFTYFDPSAEPQPTLPTTTTTEPPAVLPCRWGGPCVVGDIGPGGGTVFFNATSPWNGAGSGPYLEVSTEDVQRVRWCDQGYVNAQRATDGNIGGGKVNTDEIVKVCSSGAANKMNNATWGEKTDWYLPNTMELTLMSQFFQRQFAASQAKDPNDWTWLMWRPFGCASGYLWSSNQVDTNQATMYRLDNSGEYPMGKYEQRCAAGVRLFQYGDSSSLPIPTTTTSTTATTSTSTTEATANTDAPGVNDAPSTTDAPRVTVAPRVTDAPSTTVASTTSTTSSSVPNAVLRSIEPPSVSNVTPQKFADWVPVPLIPQTNSPDSSGKTNVDSPSEPEVSEFTLADAVTVVGKVPSLEFGVRLPKRAAKSIVHKVTVLGDQMPPGRSCTVSFTNKSKTVAKYSVKVKCQSKNTKITIVGKKKSYAAGSRLRFTITAAYGAVALEIRSVVKGVSGTPKSGIWRSRWIYAR